MEEVDVDGQGVGLTDRGVWPGSIRNNDGTSKNILFDSSLVFAFVWQFWVCSRPTK